ncbi:hypothetical protein [Thioflexithrix psekupsensis]|uniref:Uncharacterized protein n=1 Tax=Thioflexithrix psekupsensis TaxID=1570016 RepID=A0A251XA39_9GAMM|nr:hypothetical protein [Thioflexithrix psekupsensis]OUD15239.1 hypothetical protein TPSD3_01530 [Thioflexithrix psekupsensis]
MKIIIALVFFFFTGLINVYAVTPQDGVYGGGTTQGESFTFEVVGGQVKKIRFQLKPACMGLNWGLGTTFRLRTSPDGMVIFSQYVDFDENGNFAALTPGRSFPLYGFGQFDTPTHIAGEIWHAVTYFTGNGGEATTCLSTDIRFEANYIGPLP